MHTDLNITDFLTEIPRFLEDCASYGLSQDLSDKKKLIKYGNILLGEHFNLRYSKLKSDKLESDQKCLRHGISTKPRLSLCKGDNTTKTQWIKIYTLKRMGDRTLPCVYHITVGVNDVSIFS